MNRFAVYEINSSLLRGIREEGLARLQKEMLEQIHAIFGTERFTVSECAARLQQETSALKYYLDLFVDRSILSVRRQGSRPSIYELRVSPQTHPNCFMRRFRALGAAGGGEGLSDRLLDLHAVKGHNAAVPLLDGVDYAYILLKFMYLMQRVSAEMDRNICSRHGVRAI